MTILKLSTLAEFWWLENLAKNTGIFLQIILAIIKLIDPIV